MEWFESKGVPLITQEDNRVFPASNTSQSIIDCFLNEIIRLGIEINLKTPIKSIKHVNSQSKLTFSDGELKPGSFDKVIIATGGSPKRDGLQWLEELGHKMENPVPSLFTFNVPENPITKLMSVAVENVLVNIQGTKLKSSGPLLITHWGLSGPAILKLSALGARILSDMGYEFKIQVNWINETNNEVVYEHLNSLAKEHSKKIVSNVRPYLLPERLWLFLLGKSSIPFTKRWHDLGKKSLNKLVSLLTNDVYEVKGKTTFKEEFVTCGGVSLQSINLNTMESQVCNNLYFVGEVLDIDGITGGYNFQAAWTTGFIAGKLA
jgi:predicted Rossmann fold flavoprotein